MESLHTGTIRLCRAKLASAGVKGIVGTIAALTVAVTAPGLALADPPDPSLTQRIEAANQRLERVIERYNAVHEDLAASRVRARALAANLKPVTRQIRLHQQRVSEVAQLAYRADPISAAAVLLGVTSPAAMVDRLLTLDQISRSRGADLAQLRATSQRLTAQQHDLTIAAARQAAQERALAKTKRSILHEMADLERLRERARGMGDLSNGYGDDRGERAPRGLDPIIERARTSARGRTVVDFALAQRGKPYVWAAEGPWAYDCSGLAMASWRRAGVYLPHNAYRQWASVPHVSRSQLRPGDLVFYYSDIHHVAVYIGGNQVIHAPTFGESVRISPLNHAPVAGFGRPG